MSDAQQPLVITDDVRQTIVEALDDSKLYTLALERVSDAEKEQWIAKCDTALEWIAKLAESQPAAQQSTANWQDTVISMTAYEFNKQMQDAYGVGYDTGKFGRSTEVTLDDLLYHEDNLPTQPQEGSNGEASGNG